MILRENPMDKNGKTPLHQAAENGNLELCKQILENTNDIFPKMNNGNTPSHLAVANNNKEIVSLINSYLAKTVMI